MGNVWLIGDTHFFHKNIINYENRPFKSVEEMNEALITNWNNKVSKDDKVFVLGDFALCTKNKMFDIVSRLNGYKVLIMGNHDNYAPEVYIGLGFKEVYRYPIIFEDFFILSHEPMYVNKNTPYANIFAHVHGNPQFTDASEQTFCVSVERPDMNYGPIELSFIKDKMAKLLGSNN